jgi:hypothetical protein
MESVKKSSEKGQSIVILAFAFIALLGFAALAIDGGMVYANRRHAQNASDAAALAGGGAAALYLENHYVMYEDWSCSDPRVIKAMEINPGGAEVVAINRAASNDFVIDRDISDNNGVDAKCFTGEDNGSWIDKYIDVKTKITSDTPTTFAHFVYNGPLRNTVESIVRIRPRIPLAYGNAIVALGLDCDDGGIVFDGSNTVSVTGGGIFSNSCIESSGTVGVNVYGDYDISCVLDDCYTDNGGSGVMNPAPEEGTGIPLPPSAVEVPAPVCSGLPNYGDYDGDGTVEPGQYARIRIQNGDHTFEPGLFCVSDEVTINGNGTVTGTSVTFYVINGDFQTSGNTTIRLTAAQIRNCGEPCDTYHAIPGVLVYLAKGNAGEASLLGTEDSEYLGLVYVPDGTIEAGGTSTTLSEIHAQLIGKTVNIHGNTTVVINFDDQMNFQIPSSLELNK